MLTRINKRTVQLALGKSPENSKNSVCFREQSSVHNREAETHSEPLEGAGHYGGLGQQQERVEEADQDPGEQHITQLTALKTSLPLIKSIWRKWRISNYKSESTEQSYF